MNKQIELKPCPFCGGEAKITVVEKGFKSIIACKTHYCGFMRHSFNNGDTDENAAVRLATAWNRRANEKQTEGEWISVEERLPDNHRPVLVVCESTTISAGALIAIGSFGGGLWSLVGADGILYLTKYMQFVVTHWMPLPEPPKMKKTQN